jgi:hypothetical protein
VAPTKAWTPKASSISSAKLPSTLCPKKRLTRAGDRARKCDTPIYRSTDINLISRTYPSPRHCRAAQNGRVIIEPVDSCSKIFSQSSHNRLARMTVPQRWNRSLLSSSLENPRQLGVKQTPVLANQNVSPQVDCHRTLGITSHSQARDSQTQKCQAEPHARLVRHT